MKFNSIKKQLKKLTAVIVSASFALTTGVTGYAITDEMILADPVANTYTGRTEARSLIQNLSFTDLPDDDYVRESIIRTGALNMVKGYGSTYNPNAIVSKQEAIAFVMRAIGKEDVSQETALTLQNNLPPGSPLLDVWGLGYLEEARKLKIITQEQFNRAILADQTALDPYADIVRDAPARREEAVNWLIKGLTAVKKDIFLPATTQQGIYNYSDWSSIDAENAASMELAVSRGFISGENSLILPKHAMTRAQMAVMLRNMDSIFNKLMGLEKKAGTVAAIQDEQTAKVTSGQFTRTFMIRTDNGKKDVIKLDAKGSSTPQDGITDVVTYKLGTPTSLASLEEGDIIEYIVNPTTKQALYVNAINAPFTNEKIQGYLQGFDLQTATISIKDAESGIIYNLTVTAGLYGADFQTPFLYIDNVKRSLDSLPIGTKLELSLVNNVVDKIKYLGEPPVIEEARGIVIENNTEFGYITILDNNRQYVTKNYYENNLKVKKQQYYDVNDTIGYIDEVFPNFTYNPRETVVTDVEPGDIVFIRPDPEDPEAIKYISAATNYAARYGKLTKFTINDNTADIMVEYENKQTSTFTIPTEIYISKDGRPIDISDIQAGDWARLLINQAQLEPGNIMESLKEIKIEGAEHFISSIIKGQLAGINNLQKQLQVQNAQRLTANGWSNYKNIEKLSIAGKDIEFYMDGKRITLDFAVANLKRSKGEVYIAMENNFTGEKVRKVTFRTGRDELLNGDSVLSADGNGSFSVIGNNGSIATDNGTIVRRNGRLVTGSDIMSYDHAVVSLNGGNTAAVVDITDAPGITGVLIARGRILNVKDGKNFKITASSTLKGNEWDYSPVQREFTIDYNTLFLNEEGVARDEDFVGYTENSVIDKVYNIVIDGTRAAYVVDAPFSQKAIRGVIYEKDGETIMLKEATYYNNTSGKWVPISAKNSTAAVTIPKNSIIVKSNKTVTAKDLKVGDQVRVLTNTLPDKVPPGVEVEGYIILTEK